MTDERDDDYRDDPPRRERDDDRDDPRRRERPRPPEGNGMATAALVLGVLALCGGITAIPGLVCGIIGMSRAKSRGGAGQGMAIAGTVLSGFGLILLPIALLLPAVQKVRDAAARMTSSNNLKQIGIALHSHNDANDRLPSPDYYVGPRGGEPSSQSDRLSWRVAMLPYIEQGNLHSQFRLAEPWNSATNRPLSQYTIKTYLHPADAPPEPTTRYRIFYGGGAAYDLDRPMNISSIPDGASNTIAVVEGGDRVTWSQFDEYPFSMDGPLPKLGLPKASVFQAAMFDGSIRAIRTSIDPKVLKSGIHASDGLPLGE